MFECVFLICLCKNHRNLLNTLEIIFIKCKTGEEICTLLCFFSDVKRNLSFCCLLQIERIQSLDVYNTIGNKCPSLHRAMHQPALVELFQTQFGSSPSALAWFVVSPLLLRRMRRVLYDKATSITLQSSSILKLK